MINFSMGSAGMISVCETAVIKTVVTSRRFISLAKLDADIEKLTASVKVIFLEDLIESVAITDKLLALYQCYFAQSIYNKITPKPTDRAIILFTSGSEATPKGVVLSHQNILANHSQLASVISFTPQDIVLNVLPMFHSFSFTVGTLLPVLNGMKTFLYPTPLHFNLIPEISYELNATVFFGTNTFLSAYGQAAHPYDFQSIRYVFAGAEALQRNTRELWSDKFGIRIFEGYGTTETSPVLSVNSPTHYQAGSVGQFLPGIDYQLETIPGINSGQQLHVSGSNIMLGYLLSDAPGELAPPSSPFGPGWYNTGDIVTVSANGFLTICGRSKRFAKIGGEMISLAVVEKLAGATWPDSQHAATTAPDLKKGEQIILLTTQKEATLKALTATLKAQGLSTLNIPKTIIFKYEIPTLATGKTDYPAVTKLIAAAATNQK
jgi:acyl-[acyl-carrier-protein]-phospholipid O-acyltransferase/long-chain-fatty-acid--[acyl-carrier-protein] ligase